MSSQEWAFNNGPRTPKDGIWFNVYILTMVASVATGIVAWQSRNPIYDATFHAGYMGDPDHCPSHFADSHGRRLHESDPDDIPVDLDSLGRIALHGVLAAAALSAVGGAALILLFRKIPLTMVYFGLSLPFIFFVAIVALLPDPIIIGSFAALCLILAFVYWRCFKRIKMVGRMMQLAADALSANLALIPFAAGASVLHLSFVIVIGAVLFSLQTNGHVAPNPSATHVGHGNLSEDQQPVHSQCVTTIDDRQVPTPCCLWQVKQWVLPVQSAVAVVLLWSVCIVGQLRTFVLGGAITQWYFNEGVQGGVWRSLGHAIGPARGTVCFSAAIITACNLLRKASYHLERNRGKGPLGVVFAILFFLLSFLIRMIERIIKYISTLATIQAAGTGEGFMEAARSIGGLLLRHRLGITVWWVPNLVLNFVVFGAGGIVGVATVAVAHGMWKESSRNHPLGDALVLAFIVTISFWSFMGWITMFLKSATEAVYVCYARDLEARNVTRTNVHAVLKDLPPPSGAVVVQPDNNLVYGAMEEGYSPMPPTVASSTAQPDENRNNLTAAIEAEAAPPGGKGRK